MQEFNKEMILEQLFDNDFATHDFEVIPGIDAKIKNLSTDDYLKTNDFLLTVKGNKTAVLHQYAIEKLSYVLLFFKGKKIESPEQAKKILLTLPLTVIDKLVSVHLDFEKFIVSIINPDSIDKTFFGPGDLPIKPEVLHEESTSDKTEVSDKA